MKKLITLILLLSFTIKAQDVTIGTQTWTTKNLDVSKFRNGEAIPLAKTNAEWELAGDNKQPAYYENKGENGTTYGKLYNWFAVNDPRGLALSGYHIPTDAEWTILTDYLGGESIACTKMKSKRGWHKSVGNGTNTSGFAALPGGYRDYYGNFRYIGIYASWWSSSENGGGDARYRYMDNNSVKENYHSLYNGLSVRCIKD